MSIHDGHRQRMKERMLKSGMDSMCEHEILEVLLYSSIPRCDTNEHAHRLINRFGSLLKVLNAPIEELVKVEGIGINTATYLNLLGAAHRHLCISKSSEMKTLSAPDDFYEYLKSYYVGISNEVAYLLCLDAKLSVVGCYKVADGGVNSTDISIRKIVQTAFAASASNIVLSHNHPGGFELPSDADKDFTAALYRALQAVDVSLIDHIIVNDYGYISMRKTNAINVWTEL